jgi:endonuclease-3
MMKKETIHEFFRRLEGENPSPSSELIYYSPYTLLISVVLSAQATDEGVNKATPNLFEEADNPKKMVNLGEARIRELIKSIGLFNTKAKNIFLLSQLLVEHHKGEVPSDRASLEALPGVGHKTASVVLNIAFGEPTIAVDTHVFRVSNRTGLAKGKTPISVEKTLDKIVPEDVKHIAHHLLILHGRYVCTARKPNCSSCNVIDLCSWKLKELKSTKK